jgi:hypothetical protein
MGSSGHAFIAHTKALSPRAQTKDGGYGPPPHPVYARAGQRYWPRAARGRDLLIVKRVERDRVVLALPRDRRKSIRIATQRLLAVRTDGQGRQFQFLGFSPRRYDTSAYVWSIEGTDAVLCLPEWHPRRPVRLPARLLTSAARQAGAWVRLQCDLSASSAARLQPSELVATPEPPHPARLPRPDLRGCRTVAEP